MFPTGAYPTSRERKAAATPHTLAGAPPSPPQFIRLPAQLDMWGNATFGDCVTAEEAFAKACHGPEVFFHAHKVIKWARGHWVLNGAGLWDVMTLMQTDGFYQGDFIYTDGPFRFVDHTNGPLLRSAIYRGPVKLGVASDGLQNVPNCGVSNGWIATGLTPSAQDHCTSLCGYGSFGWLANQLGVPLPAAAMVNMPGYAMFTWSTVGIVDLPSLLAITGEAWLRTPTTIVTPNTPKVNPLWEPIRRWFKK